MQFRESGPVFPCAFGFVHQLICCKEECTNVAVSLRSKLDGPNAYAQPELIAALDRQAGYFKNYLFGNFHRIPGAQAGDKYGKFVASKTGNGIGTSETTVQHDSYFTQNVITCSMSD